MGVLVAKRYPTKLALGLADHTYVECTEGKGWGCWGGKTGGTALRSAHGSTRRADAIAEPDERARIACYAINGVCHQSANRILWPARITVRGARGYKLSEAIYGPYGRFRALFGLCDAPFDRRPHINGDLPECMFKVAARAPAEVEDDAQYLEQAVEIYERYAPLGARADGDDAMIDLHVQLFLLLGRRELGPKRAGAAEQAAGIRADEERERIEIERAFAERKLPVEPFVKEVNALTDRFQDRLAEAMEPEDYSLLLGLLPGDKVHLVDPDIAREAYPRGAPG
jgi:hypothetical protein